MNKTNCSIIINIECFSNISLTIHCYKNGRPHFGIVESKRLQCSCVVSHVNNPFCIMNYFNQALKYCILFSSHQESQNWVCHSCTFEIDKIMSVKPSSILIIKCVVLFFRGLYYKTLRIHNLWEMDRFCSKPVSSGMDKHASLYKHTGLSKQTHKLTTESVYYEYAKFL